MLSPPTTRSAIWKWRPRVIDDTTATAPLDYSIPLAQAVVCFDGDGAPINLSVSRAAEHTTAVTIRFDEIYC